MHPTLGLALALAGLTPTAVTHDPHAPIRMIRVQQPEYESLERSVTPESPLGERLRLAQARLERGDAAGVETLLSHDELLQNHSLRGRLAAESKDWATARAELTHALAEEPESIELRLAMASVAMACDSDAAAVLAFDEVLKLHPWNGAGLVGRGAARCRSGDAGGLDDLTAATRLYPHVGLAWHVRACCLANLGRLGESEADLVRALGRGPSPESFTNLARVRLARRDFAGVDSAVSVGLAFVSDDAWRVQLLLARAESKKADDRPAEALADAERALRLAPDNAAVLLWCFDCAAAAGDVALAAEYGREARRLDPSCRDTRSRLAWLLATCPDGTVRNGPQALALASENKRQSRDPSDDVVLAAAYAECGDFRQAEEQVRKALPQASGTAASKLKRHLESYEAKRPWRE